MFSKIKKHIALGLQLAKHRFAKLEVLDNPLPGTSRKDEIVKEYEESQVFKQLQSQMEQANQRAMVAHGPHCKDIFTCTDLKCYNPKPAKIVSQEKVALVSINGKKQIIKMPLIQKHSSKE